MQWLRPRKALATRNVAPAPFLQAAVEPFNSYNVVMDWYDHIATDPQVCHGKACVRGTRVLVSVILDNLAAGETPDQIAADYRITTDDVAAALQYAADLASERVVPLPSGEAA